MFGLFGLFRAELAMDLGTANTLIYTRDKGIVLNEPSVVALDATTESLIAVGTEAKEFLGRTPHRIKAIRPMRDGVIADFEVTRQMVSFFIRKIIRGFHLGRPNIVICVPTGITQVEKRAVIEAARQAGVRNVLLIEEPMAAAIGADLPIHLPKGSMVVDIGGGTTEVAIISLSAVAYAESVRVAGDAMDQSLQRYFQDEFRLLIGENMAERVKKTIGSAYALPEPKTMEVSGKDMVTGTPRSVVVTDTHARQALEDPVRHIVAAVRRALEKTPPELAADIADNGMLLAGGGALLAGLSQLLADVTQLKIVVDEDPLTTVVRGTGRAMENRKRLKSVFIN